MKKFIGILFLLGIMLLQDMAAQASPPLRMLDDAVDCVLGDCGRFARPRGVHHAPAYVAPVQAVYVPTYYPTYTVTYDPTGGAAGLALLEELKALRAEVKELRATTPPAAAPLASPGGALFAAKCASCHDASVAEKKSAPVLMERGLVLNRDRIPERIMEALRTGKMGSMKLPSLTAEHKLEMTYHLFDLPPAPELLPVPAKK